MIIFRGEMSNACKKYILKQARKASFTVGIITSVLFFIPVIFAAFYWDPLVLLFLIPLILAPWLGAVSPAKKDEGIVIPEKIVIDEEENTLIWESDKSQIVRHMEDVRDVTDMGNWYTIRFCYGARALPFVCEKHLLCQGTFEDFERMFQEKLINLDM